MKRKTVKFEAIREKTNALLADPSLSIQYKEGIIAMYEHVAHLTDNYNGFMFLSKGEFLAKWDTQEHVTRKYF